MLLGLRTKHKAVGVVENGATYESNIFSSDNGEDFFNNLPSPKAETPSATSLGNFVPDNANGSEKNQGDVETEESSDPSFDDRVQHSLVLGDYKGAAAQCVSANKWADALVIAHVGSASLWESTRDQYLKMSRSPFLKVADNYIVESIDFISDINLSIHIFDCCNCHSFVDNFHF